MQGITAEVEAVVAGTATVVEEVEADGTAAVVAAGTTAVATVATAVCAPCTPQQLRSAITVHLTRHPMSTARHGYHAGSRHCSQVSMRLRL